MRSHPESNAGAVSAANRRGGPRVDVSSVLQAVALPDGEPVRMREVSLGGFSVESAVRFETGCQQRFRIWAHDGRETTVVARVMHCHGRSLMTARPTYIAGFEFLPQPVGNLRLITDIVESHIEPVHS